MEKLKQISYVAPFKKSDFEEGDYNIAFECNGINFPSETIFDCNFLEANSEKVRRLGGVNSCYPLINKSEIISFDCSLMNLKATFCVDNRNTSWKLSFNVLFVLFEDGYPAEVKIERGLILQDRQFQHRIYFYDTLEKKLYSNYALDEKDIEEVAKRVFGENFISAKRNGWRDVKITLSNEKLEFLQIDLQEFSKLLNAKYWHIVVRNKETQIKFDINI